MQSLVALDTLKERLAASSQALKEADNWTTLSTDIEEVIIILYQLLLENNCTIRFFI